MQIIHWMLSWSFLCYPLLRHVNRRVVFRRSASLTRGRSLLPPRTDAAGTSCTPRWLLSSGPPSWLTRTFLVSVGFPLRHLSLFPLPSTVPPSFSPKSPLYSLLLNRDQTLFPNYKQASLLPSLLSPIFQWTLLPHLPPTYANPRSHITSNPILARRSITLWC